MLGGLTVAARGAAADTVMVPAVPAIAVVPTQPEPPVIFTSGISYIGWENDACDDAQCDGIQQWVTPHTGAGPETAPTLSISTGMASINRRTRTSAQTDAAASLRVAARLSPRRGFGVRLSATAERLGWRTGPADAPPMVGAAPDTYGGAIGLGLTRAIGDNFARRLNVSATVDVEARSGLSVRGGLGQRRTSTTASADGGVGLVAGWDLEVLSLRGHARYLQPLVGDDGSADGSPGSAIDLGFGISSRFDWTQMDPGDQWPLEIWLDARQRAAFAGGARDLTFAGGLNYLPSEGLYRVGVEVVTTRERMPGGAAVDGRALLLSVERPWGRY